MKFWVLLEGENEHGRPNYAAVKEDDKKPVRDFDVKILGPFKNEATAWLEANAAFLTPMWRAENGQEVVCR
jgi:hypothetical protein